MPSEHTLDTSLHERRRAERMRDPEYRAAYERAAREIAQTDEVIRALDELRVEVGMSKAELARRIGRNASSIRRLFTANRARPELPLVAAIADALGAEVRVVPKRRRARAGSGARSGAGRERVAA
jgi:DNA-binding phage protein